MADLWERVKKTLSEAYTTASGKAVEGVNLGVKKLDEANIRRELSREFTNLGGRAYQLLKAERPEAVGSDPAIQGHMKRLEELEKRLEEKEREIQELRRGPAPSPEPASVPTPSGEHPSTSEDRDPR
jgi:predicted RNase H-like nuclease (RuvC/YqgF family)